MKKDKHGTVNCYQNGCRCNECSQTHSKYCKNARDKRNPELKENRILAESIASEPAYRFHGKGSVAHLIKY